MIEHSKGKSPFYPGQPVPVDLFVGRGNQIDRILKRGVGQVAEGKSVQMSADKEDAFSAVMLAADEVGKKYVDQQVYKALRSKDYHSILAKIAKLNPHAMTFKKAEIVEGLTEGEKKKFNNFLQKMKDLKVLNSGEIRGDYIFNVRMVRFYIWLQSFQGEDRGLNSTN